MAKKLRHIWGKKGRGVACKHCGLVKRGSGRSVMYIKDGEEQKRKPRCVAKDGTKDTAKAAEPKRAKAGRRQKATRARYAKRTHDRIARVKLMAVQAPTELRVGAIVEPLLVNAFTAAGMLAFNSESLFLAAVERGEIDKPLREDAWSVSALHRYVIALERKSAEVTLRAEPAPQPEPASVPTVVLTPESAQAQTADHAPVAPTGDGDKNGKKSKKSKKAEEPKPQQAQPAGADGSLLEPEPAAAAS